LNYLLRTAIYCIFTLHCVTSSADYSNHPDAVKFVDTMVTEHQFERQQMLDWLASARHQESIVAAMSRPAEKSKAWHEYRKIFVTDTRISRGQEFWLENSDTL
jgi:membrane-bound lytic murein transglycosylase B